MYHMTSAGNNRIVAITGASGKLAPFVIAALNRAGYQTILFSRSPERVECHVPDIHINAYDDFASKVKGCCAVIHLAACNNNRNVSPGTFHTVNCEWTLSLAQAAESVGVRRFVHISSTHTLDPAISSPYAASKRDASRVLLLLKDIGITELVSPKIYLARKGSLRYRIWHMIGAIKPTLAIDAVVDAVRESLERTDRSHEVRLLSNGSRPWLYSAGTWLIDIGFSLTVIGVFWWLLLIIAVTIRIDSCGPSLFRQLRVGKRGELFSCWKFRTMKVGTPDIATHDMTSCQVTRIGGFLRKTKLDELPQIINLMRRQVTLVGPRPCLPSQISLIRERQSRGVLNILPGITGLAQIQGIDMSNPEQLANWDERYTAIRGLLPDLRILVQTLSGKGRGDRISLDRPQS